MQYQELMEEEAEDAAEDEAAAGESAAAGEMVFDVDFHNFL